MLVNADFSLRTVVKADEHRWVASPQAGVERVMLDRVGSEQARATSLVRYAPGSTFPPHGHPGGEEILVLSGTFSDDSGHYGAGWYLRNPPGSAHRPSSASGALIFVKLRQMQADESGTVRIDTQDPRSWQRDGSRALCPLFSGPGERVSLQKLEPGEPLGIDTRGGAELLVLEGQLEGDEEPLAPLAWLRLPPGAASSLRAGNEGARIYLKTGHLAELAGLAS